MILRFASDRRSLFCGTKRPEPRPTVAGETRFHRDFRKTLSKPTFPKTSATLMASTQTHFAARTTLDPQNTKQRGGLTRARHF
jgi:hypothetical protein